jgi:hypothetical protein
MLAYLVICFAIASAVCVLIIIISLCTHDYTKDPKTGKEKEDKIDDYLIK